jgi:hypothetical protein
MAKFKLMRLKKFRWLLGCVFMVVVAIAWQQPSLHFWQHPLGSSTLYGKLADTRQWHSQPEQNLVSHAKVTINSLPPQTTYTDEQGQFWFKGLRDISYSLKVELPRDRSQLYSFVTKVNGLTGSFFDIATDEKHNLHELDY